jgi:FixJ family two-component response regulator
MSKQGLVIAIIDDDLSVLDSMRCLLSASGYDTELYSSAEWFLWAAAASKANCLIVDVQIGDRCGIELVRQLAQAGFEFPVIFVTGSDDERVRRRALEAGCVAFLRKPFSADSLMEALAKLGR